ncbi:MAG: DUF1573 domain-containing protein [Planctomycetota bacterium]
MGIRFSRRIGSFSAVALCALTLTLKIAAQDDEYGPPIPPAAGEQPKIRIDKVEYDWGKILQGETVRHTFKVHNDGNAPLRIQQVKPGCGCTSKSFTPEIQPGGEGEIELVVDTTRLHEGNLTKYAQVLSNDLSAKDLRIFMKGILSTIVKTEPNPLRVAGLAGTPLEATVMMVAGSELGFTILKIEPKAKLLSVGAIEEIEAGRKYKVTLTAEASPTPNVNRETLELTLKTSDGQERKSEISAVVEHSDRITVANKSIVFLKRQTEQLLRSPEKPCVQDIHIHGGRDDVRFAITGVEILDVPAGVFTSTVDTVKEGFRYKVTVRLNEYRAENALSGRVLIHTDDPDSPEKTVKLHAQFDAAARAAGGTPAGTPAASGGNVQPKPAQQAPGNTSKLEKKAGS